MLEEFFRLVEGNMAQQNWAFQDPKSEWPMWKFLGFKTYDDFLDLLRQKKMPKSHYT